MAEPAQDVNLDWALYYHRLGWSVVPVRPGHKLPAVKWAEFQQRRATEEEIRLWWSGDYRGHGIGLITGEISGFFVIDVDDKELEGKNGSEVLRTLESQRGALPETTEAKTGSGGRHLLFRHPGLGIRVMTRKDIGPGRGLDVRGDGGFIVAPPSLHACGNLYAWGVDTGPEEIMPALAPDWLVDLVEDTAEPAQGPASVHEYQRERGPLGLDGTRVEDGREAYMRDTVLACLIEYIGEHGCEPTPQELYDVAWPQYAAKADFSRPGRREAEMADKCRRALQRFASGRIRGIPDLAAAVAAYQAKQRPQAVQGAAAPAPVLVDIQKGDGSKRGIQLIRLCDLGGLPPVRWLVTDWLPEEGFGVIYGPPGSLKSFLTLDVLLHIAYGQSWHGHATKAGAALYIAGEGYRGAAKRVRAWQELHGKVGQDAPFYMTQSAVSLLQQGAVADLVEVIRAEQEAAAVRFQIVAIDTVARSFAGGDENSTQDMNAYVAACDAIRDAIGTAVLGVHHTGKDKERGMRGSTVLLGAVDVAIRVERQDTVLTVEAEKQKDAEEAPAKCFRTERVEVPVTGEIEPATSLVLVAQDAPPQRKRTPTLPPSARRALDILTDTLARQGFVPPASEHIPAGVHCVDVGVWRQTLQLKSGENEESARKATKRAIDALLNAGMIQIWQNLAWVSR